MDSEQEPAEAESVFSISNEDVIDAADMDTEEEEMPACGKKPASKAVKKKPGMKKPATCSRKKPAKGSHAWEVSPSFGLVRETTASEKAYLQAKSDSGTKPNCLVNIGIPKGENKPR